MTKEEWTTLFLSTRLQKRGNRIIFIEICGKAWDDPKVFEIAAVNIMSR
jgi:hypothetical protein